MSIQDQLDAIEKRAEKATAGPWTASDKCDKDQWYILDARKDDFGQADEAVVCRMSWPYDEDEADAKFIAAARTDIPKLLAALRHALAVAGEMRQGSHQDRIIRYEGMIGTIAGILDGEG